MGKCSDFIKKTGHNTFVQSSSCFCHWKLLEPCTECALYKGPCGSVEPRKAVELAVHLAAYQ